MREKAIWAVLHKSWEESQKHERLLKTLLMNISGEQLWSAPEEDLRHQFPDVPAEVWRCFVKRRAGTDLSKVESYLNLNKIDILLYSMPEYPSILREIHQPPAILYTKGRLSLSDLPALSIAVVGSRKADAYGLHVAEELGCELSRADVCVISGLARGIDAKAHEGALKGQAGTVAVQGCGIDRVYPKQNTALAEAILAHERGCIVSEFPLGSAPLAWHFPQRNRIISGLSRGVVIVQAAVKSGAFITIETALEQGKDVFAVPGQIYNPLSAGPHRFLQEGAKLTVGVNDILEEYGYAPMTLFPELEEASSARSKANGGKEKNTASKQKEQQKEQADRKTAESESALCSLDKTSGSRTEKEPLSAVSLTEEESRVLQNITAEPVTIEELAYLCRMPIAQLMPVLSMLELYGLVQQMIGRKYIRIG